MNVSIYIQVCCRFKGKMKPRQFSLICLLFACHSNRNKETKESYPFANGLNRLNRLANLWIYPYIFSYQKPAKHSTTNSTFTTNEANFIKYFQVSNTIFQDRPIHGLVEF